jgi:hypothetical protein
MAQTHHNASDRKCLYSFGYEAFLGCRSSPTYLRRCMPPETSLYSFISFCEIFHASSLVRGLSLFDKPLLFFLFSAGFSHPYLRICR